MAPSSKTNFKTYEAQARLVRAMIAAHPEVKWNYKVIVDLFGSDMTEFALEHRFRALKAHADVVRQAREQNVDCKDVPADLPKDKKEIARMFGSSTADGIQFQFRAIKQDANTLRATVNSGGNPASVLSLGPGSTASTPRGPRATAGSFPSAASTPTTASKRSASAVSRSGASSAKRTKLGGSGAAASTPTTAATTGAAASSEGEDDEDDLFGTAGHDALGLDTPKASLHDRLMASSRKKPAPAPVSATATAASSPAPTRPATIFNNPFAPAARAAVPSVDLTTSDSEANTPPEAAPASREGVKFDHDAAPQGYGAGAGGAFGQTEMDEYFGASSEGDSFGGVDFGSFVGSENYDEI
ncbi:hypothetical protein VD0002_g6759 [Verticillium dahliae]|uniref:Uncharacterized protein n=1 Tax=Verticillium dahliae TaxID=27337 RepID=A0AA44WGK9_VERDA|nr:hypothetical protein BJF96_g5981 [Verticillium dahliae]PNH49271.1 hypothetical protein VD0003_g7877 [Verticillium dahliae]PNH60943.1 hypothetical protein VD0002_g6759 [Verticillium dahliae]